MLALHGIFISYAGRGAAGVALTQHLEQQADNLLVVVLDVYKPLPITQQLTLQRCKTTPHTSLASACMGPLPFPAAATGLRRGAHTTGLHVKSHPRAL